MYLCKRQEPGRPSRRVRSRIRPPSTTFSRQRMWDRLVRAPAMSTTRTPGRRRRRRVRRTVATPGPARLQGKRPSRRQICHRLLRGPSTCKPCEEASPGRGVSFTVRIARAEWFSGRTAWTGGGFMGAPNSHSVGAPCLHRGEACRLQEATWTRGSVRGNSRDGCAER